jgi:hypothetical protein
VETRVSVILIKIELISRPKTNIHPYLSKMRSPVICSNFSNTCGVNWALPLIKTRIFFTASLFNELFSTIRLWGNILNLFSTIWLFTNKMWALPSSPLILANSQLFHSLRILAGKCNLILRKVCN